MKVFLFALGLVASMATEKNATVFGNNLCYECYGEDGPDANLKPEGGYWGTDCFDESKLNQEKYQCTTGQSFKRIITFNTYSWHVYLINFI